MNLEEALEEGEEAAAAQDLISIEEPSETFNTFRARDGGPEGEPS